MNMSNDITVLSLRTLHVIGFLQGVKHVAYTDRVIRRTIAEARFSR